MKKSTAIVLSLLLAVIGIGIFIFKDIPMAYINPTISNIRLIIVGTVLMTLLTTCYIVKILKLSEN